MAGAWQQHDTHHLGCWWLQVLLLLTALQPAIFSILANNGNIACSPPFSSKARSQRKLGMGKWHHLLLAEPLHCTVGHG